VSARDHTPIEELLAVQALGGLDDAEEQDLRRALVAHGDCEDCRRLEVEFTDVVGRLGLSLDPVPVDRGMADRIVASSDPPRIEEAAAATDLGDRRGRRGRRWVAAVAIAVAFAVLVGGYAVLTKDRTTQVTLASQPQVVHFTPTPGTQGRLAMAFTPGQPGVLFWGEDLADPGTGKVYEVWMITNGTPVSGGCVRPTNGRIASFTDASLGDASEMAMTVESASCPGAPTTTPIMTAPLAA
jgi:hypothetical protein